MKLPPTAAAADLIATLGAPTATKLDIAPLPVAAAEPVASFAALLSLASTTPETAAAPSDTASEDTSMNPPPAGQEVIPVDFEHVLVAAGLLSSPTRPHETIVERTPRLQVAVNATATVSPASASEAIVETRSLVDAASATATAPPPADPAAFEPMRPAPATTNRVQSAAAPVTMPAPQASAPPIPLAPTMATQPPSAGEPATAFPEAQAPLQALPHAVHAVNAPAPQPLAPTPVAVAVETPAFVAGWHEETATKIVACVVRGHERAELRLAPVELGPVDIRIDVRAGEATLAIVAAHAVTRDALEQALPMLRELLAQQGVALGEASVRDGRTDARDSQERAYGSSRDRNGDAAPAPDVPAVARGRRLVDTFV